MIEDKIKELKKGVNNWATTHYVGISIFNIVAVLLFALRSAGYFHPFFPLSIDISVMILLVLSIFLLGTRPSAFFVVAFIFLLIAAFFKIVNVDVWAERTSIYVFESLLIGIIVLFMDIVRGKDV